MADTQQGAPKGAAFIEARPLKAAVTPYKLAVYIGEAQGLEPDPHRVYRDLQDGRLKASKTVWADGKERWTVQPTEGVRYAKARLSSRRAKASNPW